MLAACRKYEKKVWLKPDAALRHAVLPLCLCVLVFIIMRMMMTQRDGPGVKQIRTSNDEEKKKTWTPQTVAGGWMNRSMQ